MSILKRLFGWGPAGRDDGRGLEEHLGYLDQLTMPAISMTAAERPRFSQIGGLPSMPADIAWPDWNGAPMAFLCQIDLDEIPVTCERGGLPETGILYFFYNQEQETWGFDPKDRGSWTVAYTMVSPGECGEACVPEGLGQDYVYAKKPIDFASILTYPDLIDDRVESRRLTDGQAEEYIERCSAIFQGKPAHHLLGHPAPEQSNDMDLECQLASHGLFVGDPSGYADPRAKRLEADRSDWLLLLQLDSDDETGLMWGDCGKLYFWIRRRDLEAAQFEDCWMILQCG